MLREQQSPKEIEQRQRIIEPFILSVKETIQMMGNLPVELLSSNDPKNELAWNGVISGIIGFVGDRLTGSLALRFDEASILSIVSSMFMEEFREITPEVVDAVGELTNIILGSAKKSIHELGYQVGMAQPVVIQGSGIYLHQITEAQPTIMRYTVPNGIFLMELSFKL